MPEELDRQLAHGGSTSRAAFGSRSQCIEPVISLQVVPLSAPSLLANVQAFLYREGIQGHPVVAAVSGGPDSLALLQALRLTLPAGQGLLAAHVNHALRGPESDADEAFVAEFCRQQRIAFRGERLDVRAAAAAAGDNLESTARRLRYDWLGRVARESSAAWVATGHTANDQAETVLHHLLRGTGLRGLRGIAPRLALGAGVEVVRPLLAVTREDVQVFLAEQGLCPRQDSSNQDLALTRNRIRHRLLPLLTGEFNPQAVTILGRLARQADEVYRLLEAQARALWAEAERPRAGPVVVLDAERLARADRTLVREVFHLIWDREGWPTSAMGYVEWDRLAELVFEQARAHDLPGGVHARRRARVVRLERKQ
jgi:tRNA(Ile)-lysidine synthase